MGVAEQNLVLATEQDVYYFNLLEVIQFRIEKKEQWVDNFDELNYKTVMQEAKSYLQFMRNVPVSTFHIDHERMKIRGIDNLGFGEATLILEDVGINSNHFLVFMRLDIDLECDPQFHKLSLAQIEPIYVPDEGTTYDKITENNPIE